MPNLASQLEALFAHPDPALVPEGILAWFGTTRFPDGLQHVPVLDVNGWSSVYTRLESAAVSANVIPPLQSLLARRKAWRPDGPVHIAVTNVAFRRTTEDFERQLEELAESATPFEALPNLAEIIERQRVFAIAGLVREQFGRVLPAIRGRTVSFVLDRLLYSGNPGTPVPSSVELDCGDGLGYREAAWDEAITTTYARAGDIEIGVRCWVDGRVLVARAKLEISDTPAAPDPDESWTLAGTPSGASGVAYVFHGAGHTKVEHPIIVAEGFPGGYAPDYIHDALCGNDLLPTLLARGFDLIVVSYNGVLPMQQNAEVVEACIHEALQRVKGSEPLIVGGVSMGGVVARYALASMESRSIDHGTRLFFTCDSPHGGAYTNVSNQWLLHFLQPVSAMAHALSQLMDCPSNQQFLMQWVSGNALVVSPLRAQFLADLARVGSWPQRPKRIAIANGRGDGVRAFAASGTMLEWKGSPLAGAELKSLPEGGDEQVVASAHCLRCEPSSATLRASSAFSWDGAPGGSNDYNAMTESVAAGVGVGIVNDMAPILTAIPTVSALAIDPAKHSPFEPVPPPGSGASPFHDYLCGTENTKHISITAESSAWLAAQFGFPETSDT